MSSCFCHFVLSCSSVVLLPCSLSFSSVSVFCRVVLSCLLQSSFDVFIWHSVVRRPSGTLGHRRLDAAENNPSSQEYLLGGVYHLRYSPPALGDHGPCLLRSEAARNYGCNGVHLSVPFERRYTYKKTKRSYSNSKKCNISLSA